MFDRRFLSRSIRRCALRILAPLAACAVLLALPSQAWGVYSFTVSNSSNIFPSTTVGLTTQQTVKVTLNGSAVAIKSIVLQSAGAGTTHMEYTLGTIAGCTVDPTGATTNPSGTTCDIPVTFAPAYPGSLASPLLSRNATLVLTDGNGTKWIFALSGAATGPLVELVPGTISLFAGQPYTVTGINPQDNNLGSVAGGYGGDGGPAASAVFDLASGPPPLYSQAPNQTQPMTMDSAGNLYVIDSYNSIIRKIDNTANHIVTTIAGQHGQSGYSGDNGLATSAELAYPSALTLDAAGNIYFLDNTSTAGTGYVRIRRIDAVSGVITAVAGQNFSGVYDSVHGGGSCSLSTNVWNCGDGGAAAYADLNNARNLAIDPAGNIYIWVRDGAALREISASTGTIGTLATAANFNSTSGVASPCEEYGCGGMTLAADGNLYMVVYDNSANSGNGAVDIKEYNLTTNPGVITTAAGGVCTASECNASQPQFGIPAADFYIYPVATAFGFDTADLSSDASGNIYVTNASLVYRINLASQTAYYVAVSGASAHGAPATTLLYAIFNAQTGDYDYYPSASIPDFAGNLYMMTYNQIAVLSGSNSASFVPEGGTLGINDFTTSQDDAQILYFNVGNAGDSAPPFSFASTGSSAGTNFNFESSPTIPSPPGNAANCATVDELAAGGGCTIYLQATPTVVGLATDTLDMGSPTTQTVNLYTIGAAYPRIAVSPASLNFGNVPENTSATQYLTISSNGTATLTVYNPSTIGANYSSFVVAAGGSNPCTISSGTITLPVGSSCTLQVTFTPTAAISYSATLEGTLNTSAGSGTLVYVKGGQLIPFTGTGTSTLTAQTITFNNPGAQTVGTPLALSATATSSLAVTFSSATTSVCTVSGTQATFVASGTCTIDANQAGNSTYAAAPQAAQSFTVNGEAQTITFNNPGAQTVGTPLALSATATSSLAVTFSSATTGVCTVSGTQATFISSGTCTIDANQAGNTTYAAAPQVAQSFTVNGEAQTITFNNPGAQTVGTPLALSATATSSLAVTFSSATTSVCTVSGTQATFVSSGTCTIDANQAGNSTYAAAPQVAQSFTVNGEAQTITFNNPGAQTVGTPLSLSATATSNLAVTFSSATTGVCTVSGTQATFVTSGTCTIDANQAGNSTYAAAPQAAQSFTVNAAPTPPSFAVASPTAPQSVQPGGKATYTINVTSLNGSFNSPVTLAVTSTLPAGATASFSQNPVTPGAGGASPTLTIQTATATASAAHGNWPLAMPVLCLVGLFFVPGKRCRRWLTTAVMLFAALGALAAFSGCGGGFALGSSTAASSGPVSYIVTITGTGTGSSGSVVQTTTVQLTVQ